MADIVQLIDGDTEWPEKINSLIDRSNESILKDGDNYDANGKVIKNVVADLEDDGSVANIQSLIGREEALFPATSTGVYMPIIRDAIKSIYINGDPAKFYTPAVITRNIGGRCRIRIYESSSLSPSSGDHIEVARFDQYSYGGSESVEILEIPSYGGSSVTARIAIDWTRIPDAWDKSSLWSLTYGFNTKKVTNKAQFNESLNVTALNLEVQDNLSRIKIIEQTARKNTLITGGVVESENGYYNAGTGVFVPSSNYKSLKFNVDDDDKRYCVTSTTAGSVNALAVYYDENNIFIGSDIVTAIETEYTKEPLTVPIGTRYIGLSKRGGYTYAELYLDIFNAVNEEKATEIANNILTGSYWKDKNIAWFGTSIPATGYPQLVGAELGANIYNEAVGSSMARSMMNKTGVATRVGLDYVKALRSMGDTLVEKQHYIDNWNGNLDATGLTLADGGTAPFDFGWKDLLTGTPPSDLSTVATTADILGWSHEFKLVAKYLNTADPDFIVSPDLFVFDHGYNDLSWLKYDDTVENAVAIPAIRNDRSRINGAMNYMIDLIFKYNPRARIAFCGHYENTKFSYIAKSQEILSAYWEFPIAKLWEQTGWSQQEIETTGYWDNGVWYNSGGVLQTLTIAQTWLDDGLHPNPDESKALITALLVPFLKRVV